MRNQTQRHHHGQKQMHDLVFQFHLLLFSWYIVKDSSSSHCNIPFPFYQPSLYRRLKTVRFICKILKYVNVDLYFSLWL